jgi:hypothetical protein
MNKVDKLNIFCYKCMVYKCFTRGNDSQGTIRHRLIKKTEETGSFGVVFTVYKHTKFVLILELTVFGHCVMLVLNNFFHALLHVLFLKAAHIFTIYRPTK